MLDSLLGTTAPTDQGLATPGISGEETETPATSPRSGSHTVDPDDPPIAAVRDLLEAAFNPGSLKQFCQDRSNFRPLVARFATADGLGDMVERVIEYCGEFLLWDELLAEVAAANPAQYARFAPRLTARRRRGGSPS